MTPGFRYHLATIVGIFLALGVGIIIGSSFVQSAIVQQQTRRLDDLQAQFRRDVVAAQDRNRHYADFTAALTPRVSPGLRVALVQTGDYDLPRRLREALEQAGATVSSTTVVDRNFPTRSQVVLARVLPDLQVGHPGLAAQPSSLIHVLAGDLARGGPDSDLAALESAQLIRRDGDYSRATDVVILMGGAAADAESRADTVDVPLAQELRAAGARVVAIEAESTDISYVTTLRQQEVTTIDNADTDIGRLAVILALRADTGTFGVKPTARSGPLPPNVLTNATADDLRHRASAE